MLKAKPNRTRSRLVSVRKDLEVLFAIGEEMQANSNTPGNQEAGHIMTCANRALLMVKKLEKEIKE